MKVEYYQTVEVNGHANIGIEEIQSAIMEAMSDVDITISRGDCATGREREFVVHGFANAIYQALEGIADEAIAASKETVRKSFAEALRKHADRWASK
jgi:hypothetical protein